MGAQKARSFSSGRMVKV